MKTTSSNVMSLVPEVPKVPAHQADRIVAATRIFNGLLRAAEAARMPLAAAIRQAAGVALRETGVDLLAELGDGDEHVRRLEEAAAAGHDSELVKLFFEQWRSGQLGLPMSVVRPPSLYEAFAHWCLRREAKSVLCNTGFTAEILRLARHAGLPQACSRSFNLSQRQYVRGVVLCDLPVIGRAKWAGLEMRAFDEALAEFKKA
jgi:hypothetical protein